MFLGFTVPTLVWREWAPSCGRETSVKRRTCLFLRSVAWSWTKWVKGMRNNQSNGRVVIVCLSRWTCTRQASVTRCLGTWFQSHWVSHPLFTGTLSPKPLHDKCQGSSAARWPMGWTVLTAVFVSVPQAGSVPGHWSADHTFSQWVFVCGLWVRLWLRRSDCHHGYP